MIRSEYQALNPHIQQLTNSKLRDIVYKRSVSSVISHLSLSIVFYFIAKDYIAQEPTTGWVLASVVVLCLARAISAKILLKENNLNIQWLHDLSVVFSSTAWGLVAGFTLYDTGLSSLPSVALFITGAGIASGGAFSLSPIPWLSTLFILQTLGIPGITVFNHDIGGVGAGGLTALFFTYILFLILQSRSYYKVLLNNVLMAAKSAEEKNLTAAALDSVPGFVIFFDKDLNYSIVNKRLSDKVDGRPLLGRKLGSYNPEAPLVKAIQAFAANPNETANTAEFQLEGIFDNHWHLITMQKVSNPEGIIVLGIDIQDLKVAHQEIELQKASVESSSRLAELGVMAGGIAHEINNPLAIISGRVQNLILQLGRGRVDDDKLKIDLTSVEQTSHRIARIVRGLRSFARNSENDPLLPESIGVVIEDALSLCQSKLYNLQINLKMNVKDPETKVACRPAQLSQVILNIVNNSVDAIEAMPERWIQIDADTKDGKVIITVTDSGKGIDPVIREKIMTPFFTTKAVGKGTGLGLSISHGIMSSHNGKLYLDADSTNTRFVIELPIHADANYLLTS